MSKLVHMRGDGLNVVREYAFPQHWVIFYLGLHVYTFLFSIWTHCVKIIVCRCYVCQQTKTVEIDRGRIAEPAVCPNCQTLHSMALIHNRSSFNDKQMVKLQESPDDMPPGQTPHTVVVYAHHDLVDSVQPGDR